MLVMGNREMNSRVNGVFKKRKKQKRKEWEECVHRPMTKLCCKARAQSVDASRSLGAVAEFCHFSMTSSQKREGEQAELTVLELWLEVQV